MKPQVAKFVDHLISLVRKEMTLDQKEIEKILSGPSNELQQKDVAVLNLTVVDIKPGVGNSINLVLEIISKTRRRATIPQSKLRVGDIVALKEYNLYYEKEMPHYTGIIVGINKWCITL